MVDEHLSNQLIYLKINQDKKKLFSAQICSHKSLNGKIIEYKHNCRYFRGTTNEILLYRFAHAIVC